jgi:hypothetical protein
MSRTSSSDSERADPVMQWLRRHGFTANPFAEWEASKEEWLQRYFVSLPFFDKLYGNPEHPVTTFLFAGRGCGKSAHRVIVQMRSRPHNPHDTVLAIPYTDFTSFLNQSGTALVQSTLDSHLKLILKKAFEILLSELTQRSTPWFDLLPDEQSEFKRLVLTFAPDLLRPADLARWLATYSDNKISLHDLQSAIKQNDLGILKTHSLSDSPALSFWCSFLTTTPSAEEVTDGFLAFRRYVYFVRAIGLDAVYVLVDGIDELLPSVEPQIWADFLLPLVTALPLMEMPHVAFKFFLPTTVGATLKKHDNARFDRFRTFDLHWDAESLKELLALRLSSFNKKGINSLKALAEENAATIEDDLIRKAQGSPRAMILMGHLMFEAHCADVSKPDLLLKTSDLKNAIERFNREYQSLVTSVPLMRVDEKAGRLYIGGRPVDVKLSKREFKVLEFLYRGRGMVRSEAEIVEAIGYVSNIAFDSMISRLRAKIESDPDNPIYLVTERGRGYRLANTE